MSLGKFAIPLSVIGVLLAAVLVYAWIAGGSQKQSLIVEQIPVPDAQR